MSRGWVGSRSRVGWVGSRGRGRDPTCDRYGGKGEPSVVAKVHVCGIVLPVV